MKKKMILVANYCKNNASGPANIVRGLLKEYSKEGIPCLPILYDGSKSKLTFVFELLRVLITEKPTIVNVHTDGFLIPLIVHLCSIVIRKHSYYLTVHGLYGLVAKMENNKNNMYVLIETYLYKRFQNLICVSEMLKRDLEKYYGREENVYIIPNATDAKSDKPYVENSVKEVISLGGLRLCKGLMSIIDLACVIKQNELPIHISIYGGGLENYDLFVNMVEKKNLKSIIDYKGIIQDKKEVYDTIKLADAQICFSKYDTYNVAIAESVAIGCPCISTERCGAATLIKNNYTGLVINLKDSKKNKFVNVTDFIMGLDIKKRLLIEKDSSYYKIILSWENVARQYMELK